MLTVSYRTQIIFLIFWVFVVTALFKLMSDRQSAAVIAGVGFILMPLFFLISEFKNNKNPFHLFTLIFFLTVSALPILGLRVLNWGAEFDSLHILGIQAHYLHKISSYLYMLILISAVYCYIKYRKQIRK
jgi:hypothetical protein